METFEICLSCDSCMMYIQCVFHFLYTKIIACHGTCILYVKLYFQDVRVFWTFMHA